MIAGKALALGEDAVAAELNIEDVGKFTKCNSCVLLLNSIVTLNFPFPQVAITLRLFTQR